MNKTKNYNKKAQWNIFRVTSWCCLLLRKIHNFFNKSNKLLIYCVYLTVQLNILENKIVLSYTTFIVYSKFVNSLTKVIRAET